MLNIITFAAFAIAIAALPFSASVANAAALVALFGLLGTLFSH
jgi:hypothetical protein